MSDRDFLIEAYRKATESPDPSTQNGAILVRSGEVIGRGCNTFVRGVRTTADRLERPKKYQYIEHAERNTIFDASRNGFGTEGTTLYCPWHACSDCGRAIIAAGVRTVVGHRDCLDKTPPHWKDSIAAAFEMYEEAGIELRWVDGALGAPTIRFNGEHWNP